MQLSMLCHAYSILKEMLKNLFSFGKTAVDAMAKMHPLDLHFIQSRSLPVEDLFITVFIFRYKKNKRWMKIDQKRQGKEIVP